MERVGVPPPFACSCVCVRTCECMCFGVDKDFFLFLFFVVFRISHSLLLYSMMSDLNCNFEMTEMYLRLFFFFFNEKWLCKFLFWGVPVLDLPPTLHTSSILIKRQKRGKTRVPIALSAWTKRAWGIATFFRSGSETDFQTTKERPRGALACKAAHPGDGEGAAIVL